MAGLPKWMHLKNLLLMRFEWFEDALMKALRGTPYEGTTRAESRILSHLHYRQMSAADLGRVLAISRQAAHRTVQRLIRKGWLVTKPHPTNARIKLIQPSPAITRSAFARLDALEARLAKKLGRRKVAALRRVLAEDWG
jgi:DNA-binding MarR family transcriptional regulator